MKSVYFYENNETMRRAQMYPKEEREMERGKSQKMFSGCD